MLNTTGIHHSRRNSQKLNPSHIHLHKNQGDVHEWNNSCHSATSSSYLSPSAPSYSSLSTSSSNTQQPFSQYQYSSSQTPTPTPSTITITSSTRVPASSSSQDPLAVKDTTTKRPPSLTLTSASHNELYQTNEDRNNSSSNTRSPNTPKLSPRLQALHAQLGTQPSRTQYPLDMASVSSGVDPKTPINPKGRIFGGWLSGNPSPNTPSSSGTANSEEGLMSPPLSSPSLSSPGLSPDSNSSKPLAARPLSAAGNSSLVAHSESVTPRNVSPAVANPKRLSLLQSSISAITWLAAPAAAPEEPGDVIDDDDYELLHLDIEAALYPGGSPNDTFSPAAYKNLQMNALGVLQKVHSAYRVRTIALRALEVECDSQKEDLIEARTRALRLKQQVENMTKQAAEQERSMMELMNELATEKRARINEKDERERNLNMVPEAPEVKRGGSFIEDLGVDEEERQHKWRKSAGTIRSDMSFDTDEESVGAESVFSRSRSPTITSIAPTETTSTTPIQTKAQAAFGPPRSRSSSQISAFQKILKGMGKTEEEDGCRNCKGQDASVAWDTVSLLRDENKVLKSRVGELEVAVDSAMDIVNGVGM
ncbi:hypothetical protein MKZ38_006513 [Zalerion maritima]|uniref:Uncharacterized protein n=1 Tax=Zalerion maritima TaxID=339359 RepID=A0AAD5S6H9_9PEZI|nr:hypothetical protein MKZ38_006513 [Zalerion maritima]